MDPDFTIDRYRRAPVLTSETNGHAAGFFRSRANGTASCGTSPTGGTERKTR